MKDKKIQFWISVGVGVIVFFAFAVQLVIAATNINSDANKHWAWNDLLGWVNFYQTNTVQVTSQKIEGYASSSAGDISLDCATTRNGNICSSSDYRVVNDGNGNLSGWGWNDAYGWISFYCGNHSGCGASNYRVYVDANGEFHDYAWNEVVGWVSFNCANHGGCGSSDYKVVTGWIATSSSGLLESSTFDTGITGGVQINSVLWQGIQPPGTSVRFQFAVSSSSGGPWNFKGPDGTSSSYYVTDPGVSKPVDYALHNNVHYFRYRIELISDLAQTASPHVQDIIVNWSP